MVFICCDSIITNKAMFFCFFAINIEYTGYCLEKSCVKVELLYIMIAYLLKYNFNASSYSFAFSSFITALSFFIIAFPEMSETYPSTAPKIKDIATATIISGFAPFPK